jgi:hypothetical protein
MTFKGKLLRLKQDATFHRFDNRKMSSERHALSSHEFVLVVDGAEIICEHWSYLAVLSKFGIGYISVSNTGFISVFD